MRKRQLKFDLKEMNLKTEFGGSLLKKSHAKTKRPITTKRPMHLVMRSSMAVGAYRLLRKNRQIVKIINEQGRKHGVKIYKQANGGNHIHLVILPRSRQAFNDFVRSVSGLIARLVLGSQRGNPKNRQFWDQRPFSKIIEWGRQFRYAIQYLNQNTLEALGFIEYRPRVNSTA